MRSDFAVFILTHRRANNVITYRTLRKHGYTGRIVLLVDDQDPQQDEYKRLYGNEVVIFDKEEAARHTDSGDNFGKLNSVIYARNASYGVAQELGLSYFMQMDDDYTTFRFTINHLGEYITRQPSIKSLDRSISYSIDFMESSGFDCVCFSQGGDFIGGEGSGIYQRFAKGEIPRKAMNSFIFRADTDIRFIGKMNDDVNTYIRLGSMGKLFGTLVPLRLEQKDTQSQEGGLTDMYLDAGTYVKSFYSVMFMPSAVTIKPMGNVHKRLHHQIKWNNVAPKIVSEKWRKALD